MLLHRIGLPLVLSLVLAATVANGQVKLQTKHTPGAEYKTRETVSVQQSLTLNGQEIVTAVNTTNVSRVKHGSLTDDGALPITKTYESMKADLKLPGNIEVKFDSADPDAKSDNEIAELILDRFRAFKGLALTHTVSAQRKVLDIEGIKQDTGINREELTAAYQQELNRFPDEPLKKGDTWKVMEALHLGEGQVFTFEREYTYAGTVVSGEKELDKVEAKDASVKYSIREGGGNPAKVTKSELTVDSSQHTFLFDRQLGRVVSVASKLHITGELGLEIMNMEFDGELDLTMTIKSEEVK